MYRIYFGHEMVNRAALYLDEEGDQATNESNTLRLRCDRVDPGERGLRYRTRPAWLLTPPTLQRWCGARGEV